MNRSCLFFRALSRTPFNPCDIRSPLCVGWVLGSMLFSSVTGLPSTTSAVSVSTDFVRQLRRYYTDVRLLACVHARIVLLASRADPAAGKPGYRRDLAEAPIKGAGQVGSRARSFSTCSWLWDYAGPVRSIAIALPPVLPSRCKHTVGARIAFFEAQFPARRCLCLRFTRHLAAPSARLEVEMVRYSFLVGLFHPRLHAGLSRRLHLLTRVAR